MSCSFWNLRRKKAAALKKQKEQENVSVNEKMTEIEQNEPVENAAEKPKKRQRKEV